MKELPPPLTMLGLMQSGRKRTTAPTDISDGPPRDCVRQYPTLSPETIELIGFDSDAQPQIRVELPRGEDLDQWRRWLLRWVRRREQGHHLRVVG